MEIQPQLNEGFSQSQRNIIILQEKTIALQRISSSIIEQNNKLPVYIFNDVYYK